MRKIIYLSLVFLGLFACKSIEEPIEYISYDGSSVELFSGQLIKVKAGFHVENKLWVPLKMKPGSFELFIDQQKIGDLYIDSTVKLKAHSQSALKVPLRIVPEPGFITIDYKATKKPVANIKISGYPKIGTAFVYKTSRFSIERQFETSQFTPYFPSF